MASRDLSGTVELLKSHLHTTAIIFLTVSENTEQKRQMLRLGARLLSKGCSARKLQTSLWDAALGGTPLENPGAEDRPTISSNTAPEQRIERLTRRESQLLPLVCGSLKNKEIARQLSISESTVWHHLTSIFAKLEVEDRLGLATFAHRHQLVVPDAPPRQSGDGGGPSRGAEETYRAQTLKYPPAVHITGRVSRTPGLHAGA